MHVRRAGQWVTRPLNCGVRRHLDPYHMAPRKLLPPTRASLVLRTDFSDDASWRSIYAAIQAPVGDCRARVECVGDRAFDGVGPSDVQALVPKGWNHSFLFLADRIALLSAEQPVLVVDLTKRRGARFALFPAKHGVSNNLYSDRFKVTVVPLSDLPGQPSRADCRATARGACASLHDT
jgi:hypothetical protein